MSNGWRGPLPALTLAIVPAAWMPHVYTMDLAFDFTAPAEVFTAKRMGSKAQPVTYRRFGASAEAVQYVIEVLPASKLASTVLEAGEERYDGKAIRELYDSQEYPLPRTLPPALA